MTNRIKSASLALSIAAALAVGIYFLKKTSSQTPRQDAETPAPSDSQVSIPTQDKMLNPADGSVSTSSIESTQSPEQGQLGAQVHIQGQALPSGARVPGNDPANPAPGTNLPVGAPSSTTAQLPPKPVSGCFDVSFRHRKLPTHTDAESCHRHSNRIKLAHSLKELKGLCVRVDGDAVAFNKVKGTEKEIIVGSFAGPDSLIKISYCMGQAQCKEDCKIKPRKDSFLEAVGGVSDEKGSDVSEWDSEGATESDKKAVREVAAEIHALEGDLKNEKDEDNVEFSGWVGDSENPATSCEIRKQAQQKDSPRG